MKPNESNCELPNHRYKYRPDKSRKNKQGVSAFFECMRCTSAYACIRVYRQPKTFFERLRYWTGQKYIRKEVHNCPDREECRL